MHDVGCPVFNAGITLAKTASSAPTMASKVPASASTGVRHIDSFFKTKKKSGISRSLEGLSF
jgi:hypothetical protein